MSVATKISSWEQVQALLKSAAHGEISALGGLELWTLPYERLMAAQLGGLPLIDTKKTGSCCGSGAAGAKSALLLGLRGKAPFDGSQYPQLPWGKPAMSA